MTDATPSAMPDCPTSARAAARAATRASRATRATPIAAALVALVAHLPAATASGDPPPAVPAASAPGALTALERRWIDAAAPVLADARRDTLPLDVVVQPQPNAGEPPLALAWIHGRCKLVLTMRGADGAPLPPPDLDATLPPDRIRAMFAHEVGHCWRHVHGAWRLAPSGFVRGPRTPPVPAADARLEEAFADLYALAWTASRAPAAYRDVHAWLARTRVDPHPGDAEHDTGAWVAAAADPGAFGPEGTPYARAERLWRTVSARLPADRSGEE